MQHFTHLYVTHNHYVFSLNIITLSILVYLNKLSTNTYSFINVKLIQIDLNVYLCQGKNNCPPEGFDKYCCTKRESVKRISPAAQYDNCVRSRLKYVIQRLYESELHLPKI